MSNNKANNDNTNYWPLIILSVGVVGLFALSWWWLTVTINNPEKQAQFGGQFGAVNALFSGLAFAGLIFTIILQKKELSLQREELTETRAELRGQKEQMEEQNKTLQIQRFESTFFHMLELHQQNVCEISVGNDHGRLAFNRFFEILRARYQAVVKTVNEIMDDKSNNLREKVILSKWNEAKVNDFCMRYAYGHFFYGRDYHVSYLSDSDSRSIEECVSFNMPHNMSIPMGHSNLYTTVYFSSQLGHYYRHIYHIVRFVEHQNILDDNEKYQYVKMLRSQLSDDEQVLFYYNALSAMGEPWIRHKEGELPLIIKYKLIKNIPHYIHYFYNDPRKQFAKEIAQWRELHHNKHFFEQLVQL